MTEEILQSNLLATLSEVIIYYEAKNVFVFFRIFSEVLLLASFIELKTQRFYFAKKNRVSSCPGHQNCILGYLYARCEIRGLYIYKLKKILYVISYCKLQRLRLYVPFNLTFITGDLQRDFLFSSLGFHKILGNICGNVLLYYSSYV